MKLSRSMLLRLAAGGLGMLLAPPVRADGLALHVTGKLRDGDAELDAAALSAMGKVDLVTATPWTEGEIRFSGVPFEVLQAALGMQGDEVVLRALNDYSVLTSAAVLVSKGAMVAFEIDGKPIPVREKGPFWIIFPWSARADLNDPGTHSLSIWQLQTIEIR